jgi:tungstate transport system substrate-binding protein
LWRQAGVAPVAPWYVALAPGDNLIAQVRARGAFALVERAAWLARGGAPLAVRVDGDPRLAEEVHVMRAFRVNHPAGKIFVAWIASAKGRRVVAAHRGYRAGA